jgi:hypothetical protein
MIIFLSVADTISARDRLVDFSAHATVLLELSFNQSCFCFFPALRSDEDGLSLFEVFFDFFEVDLFDLFDLNALIFVIF